MGGKTSTSTSQVQIPPEVLARYNSVNAQAQQVAAQPFQQYSTNPNAFVAPLDPTQYAGMANINNAVGMAQPYFQSATGFALAGANPVNPQPLDVGTYMNPYLQTVLGSTEANVNQQNQQAMAGQLGNAINQGYFGGDRSGIAAAVLAGQQQLTGGQLYSGIASDAYNQAMQAAIQQQQTQLGAAQANRAAQQQTAGALAGLGTGAQGSILQGAQAQLGAGQVEQQTAQAGLSALYNQFLQQQSYPFQVAQFLANIAEGTGALSGNTTTTTQPGGLFSDARLKTDIERIGTGFDGANIYRFRYRGDPDNVTRIGFMAQEVEQTHPEAVSIDPASGFKMVNYDLATRDSAGFARAANDDYPEYFEPRRARATGGRIARQMGGMSQMGMYPAGVNPFSISELLQAQAQMYGPFTSAGLYGNQGGAGSPYGGPQGHVPPATLPVPQMIHGTPPPAQPSSSALNYLHDAAGMAGDVKGIQQDAHMLHQGYDAVRNMGQPSLGDVVNQASAREDNLSGLFARGGFARAGYDDGGSISDTQNDDPYASKGFGPALNIPTSGQHPQQLQAAKPASGGSGQGGLGQLLGAGADIATIAKAAPEIGSMAGAIGSGIAGAAGAAGSGLSALLPFLMLANRGGRVGYDDGGQVSDLPDGPVGASLDIPTQEPNVHPLEPASPSKQSGSGDQTMQDIMDIAKIAAMFAGAKRGGRIGYAAGGDPVEEALAGGDPSGPDEVENILLRRFQQQQAAGSGFAAADAAQPPAAAAGKPAGGGGGPGAPSAGFAGAGPPGASAAASAAKPGGFAGATPAGLPAGFAGIFKAEGTGKNPMSSAQGPGQFIDSTFKRMFRKVFPDRAAGMSDGDILALRHGPEGAHLQMAMIPALDAENTDALVKAGYDATPANRHLAWVLGAGGAKKVLGADPSTPLSQLLSPQAIAANARIMAGKTAGDFINWARKGMNKGGRAGFQDGGDIVSDSTGDPSGSSPIIADPDDPTKVLAADPTVVAAAQANRLAAAAGDPRATPAAQDAVGGRDLSAADQSTAPKPTVEDTENAGLKYGEQASAQATQQAQRVIGGQEASKPFWKNPDFLIPAFTGLADMLAAPTKYPLVALTQGIKGGAQAYQGMRAYDASQALTEQERATLGLGETAQAYTAGTQRRNVNAAISGQLLSAFDANYTPQPAMQSEDGSGQKWLGPNGYITNAQHAALRSQIIQGTYGGLAQSGEATGPLRALPLVMSGGAGAGPSPAGGGPQGAVVAPSSSPGGGGGGGNPQAVVPSPPAGPAGPSVDQARGGVGHPAGVPGGAGGAGPDGTVGGSGTGQPAGQASAPAASPAQVTRRQGEDVIDFHTRRGDYGNPITVAPLMSREDAARLLTPQTNPYLLSQVNDPSGQSAKTAQDIFDGKQDAQLQAGGVYTGFRDRKAQQAQYDAAVKAAEGQRTARQAQTRQWSQDAAQQKQSLHKLESTYQRINPATISPQIANLTGIGSSIPGVRDLIPQDAKDVQGLTATAQKIANTQQLLLAEGLHGAPATGAHIAGGAVPGPDMPVDARYAMVKQMEGQLDWQTAKNAAEARLGGQLVNYDKFDTEFEGAHKVDEFVDKAHPPFFKGQSMESRKANAYVPTKEEYENNLRPGDPYIRIVNGKRVWAIKGQGGQ